MKTNTVISNAAVNVENGSGNGSGNGSSNGANGGCNNGSDIILGTNWTYADAASMANECRREARLFPTRRRNAVRRPSLSTKERSARFMANFAKQTGWTFEAASSMAKDAMRDNRLFGRATYASL